MNEDKQYIEYLNIVCSLIKRHLTHISDWDSLIINRREPYTYRAWKILDNGYRVCLHRFDPCINPTDMHPHPWPAAFKILQGKYEMRIGSSKDSISDPVHVCTTLAEQGFTYAITDPYTWHAVQPLTTCYSIMINGPRWVDPHERTPSTANKNLNPMSLDDLAKHLNKFKELL